MFPYADIQRSSGQKGYFTYSNLIAAPHYFSNVSESTNTTVTRREVAAFLAQTAHEGQVAGQRLQKCSSMRICLQRKWLAKTWGNFTLYTVYRMFQHVSLLFLDCFWCFRRTILWKRTHSIVLELQLRTSITGHKMVLVNKPMAVSNDGVIGFVTALWFWSTSQYEKPSAHAITESYLTSYEATGIIPIATGGRKPGFGLVTNIINGGMECGNGVDVAP
jgi:hypothetical protein